MAIGVVVLVQRLVGVVVLVLLSSMVVVDGVVLVVYIVNSGGVVWCSVVGVGVGGGVEGVVAIVVGWDVDGVELVDGAMIGGWVVVDVGCVGIVEGCYL
jgi:hypothetical protein